MAQSARAAELLARRQAYNPYGTGSRIKLLSPANNTISSIASKTANSEMDVMVKNYNAGTVSNSDFLAFLQKMQTNPGISAVDKADISNQITDFNSRILGDKLTTAYKNSPDNTAQQLQSAQALANYFRTRASSFQPDTPAYTDAMNNAATYDSHVATIQSNITTKARQNQRYVLEQKVNQIQSGTSANAQAKAEMWRQLYDQANADGDTTAANQYAANYQQELTNADTYATKETASANKKKLGDFINTTIDDYHRGKISGDEAIQQLQQADQFASDTNDTASQLRLQSLYQTISREVDKGITYNSNGTFGSKSSSGGGTGEFYLNPDGSVTYGGGTTGTTSRGTKPTGPSVGTKISPNGLASKTTSGPTTQTNTFTNGRTGAETPAQLDLEYQNALNDANKALVAGTITADQYKQSIMLLTKSRQVDLQQLTDGLKNVADPNSKLGKKALTLLDTYTTELGNVTGEYNDIRTGRLVVGIQNSSFTDPTGKSVSKQILSLVPNNAKMVNVNGVHYTPQTEALFFGSQNDANNYFKAHKTDIPNGMVGQDENGRWVVKDANGNAVQGDVLHVNDTNGNDIVYQQEGNGYLPVGVGPKTAALRSRIAQEKATADKNGTEYKPNIMNYNDINKFNFATPVQKPASKPGFIDSVVAAGKKQGEVIAATPPKVTPPSIPTPTQPSGQISLPQPVGSGTVLSTQQLKQGTNAAPLKLAGTPSSTNVALKQAINPTGTTPIKVASVPSSPVATPQQAAKIASVAPNPNQYSVANSLKKLVNTLSFGLIKL